MENHSVSEEEEDNNVEASPADISVEIPGAESTRRRMHRVPPQLRLNKNHVYDPVILSLGPYHHGQPQLRQAEELKEEVLNMFVSANGSKDRKDFLYNKILERIDEIRSHYVGVTIDEYDDKALAEMILRDAYFLVCYMEIASENEEKGNHIYHRLGMSGAAFMYRDFLMLENQIPLWVVTLLIGLTFDKDEGEALIYKYLSLTNFGDQRLTRVPWKDEDEEPLHLLEANRRTLVEDDKTTKIEPRIFEFRWRRKKCSHSLFKMASRPFRSVTDLKAKGIHFGPSSNCLKDIRFKSYSFYGQLKLPIWFVTYNTKVFFSNIIAFEMSPETDTDFAVISYVNFMKSLIESPKDVKELREKGILFSLLGSDEEIVKVFKDMDTYGTDNFDIFQEVKMRIEEHCDSKTKTWMAELIHTNFRTPWTVIALFAASFLLCLTFLQTYYTIRPAKGH